MTSGRLRPLCTAGLTCLLVGISLGATAQSATPSTTVSRPSVFLFLIDTLRPDHMGCYGYDKVITPNIDRLAARSVVYEQAHSQSPWTKTAVASLLTGLHPHRHGVYSEHGAAGTLPQAAVTIAEILHQQGYRTVGVSGNPHVSRRSGFDQGFDSYTTIGAWPQTNNTREVTEKTLEAVAATDPGTPAFFYVHFLDPHDPWANPEGCTEHVAGLQVTNEAVLAGNGYVLSGEWPIRKQLASGKQPEPAAMSDDEVAYLLGLYDCEISQVDRHLGRVLLLMQRRGLLDDSIIIICSDHGEEFLEHGMLRHGYQLFGETVRVPLIISLPGERRGRRITEVVELTSVVPSLLAQLGLEPPPGLDGGLLPGLPRSAAAQHGSAFGITRFRAQDKAYLLQGDGKLIWDLQHHRGSLFDLDTDRAEQHPLSPQESPLGQSMLQQLHAWIEDTSAAALPRDDDKPETENDDDMKEQLQALGYIE